MSWPDAIAFSVTMICISACLIGFVYFVTRD
jgi:hypothetical protein